MPKELYLVTFNGYCGDGYGADIYLGGVFDSRDKADEYIRGQKDLAKTHPNITVTPVNHGYETARNQYDDVTTDIYLGGYVE